MQESGCLKWILPNGEPRHDGVDGAIVFKSGVGKLRPTLNMQKRNIMDLAGGTLVISSCW